MAATLNIHGPSFSPIWRGRPVEEPDQTGPCMARDAILAWFRGEFAAANAIIDALLSHLSSHVAVDDDDYSTVFQAVHRRRMNWIPVLHLQKYFPIADVANALRHVETSRERKIEGKVTASNVVLEEEMEEDGEVEVEGAEDPDRSNGDNPAAPAELEEMKEEGNPPASRSSTGNGGIWSDEDPVTRPDRIKMVKGFVAKEPVKGHLVNVVKGLKLYEGILTTSELAKLTDFVRELRLSGRRGELSGSTFIYFNQQLKGNKRELIQLGTPIFQPATDDSSSHIEPIPEVLMSVIDHLIQWQLIPENKRPNSCIINFFDEDEHSQPYFKPPHLENPVSTLVLSETTMAFGRVLVGDHQGAYKGTISLSLKNGSLLVMRGNSADLARHVICPSPNQRITLTFVKVRQPEPVSPPSPSVSPSPLSVAGKEVILPPPPVPVTRGAELAVSVSMAGRRMGRGGTGVFLPWTGGARKYHKQVPPRIQRRRLAALLSPPPLEAER